MFSFENVRNLVTEILLRRKNILVLALVGMSAAVISGMLLIRIFQRPTPFELARDALSPQTQVLFIGSSHVYMNLDPSLFSRSTMNVGGPDFDYVHLYEIVTANLDRAPNVKRAYVEFDAPLFLALTEEFSPFHMKHLRDWGVTRRPGAFETLRAWTFDFDAQLRDLLGPLLLYRLTPHELSDPAWQRESQAGFVPHVGDFDDKRNLMFLQRLIAELEKPGREQILAANKRAFVSLSKLLRSKNIELELLLFPYHPHLMPLLPARWALLRETLHAELEVALSEKIKVIDVARMCKGFSETEFRDYDHMNSAGVLRMSQCLDSL